MGRNWRGGPYMSTKPGSEKSGVPLGVARVVEEVADGGRRTAPSHGEHHSAHACVRVAGIHHDGGAGVPRVHATPLLCRIPWRASHAGHHGASQRCRGGFAAAETAAAEIWSPPGTPAAPAVRKTL